ncbi:MAG TPA: type II toxin-antitoxin system VapC family toxin [Nitriliruptorales bacterium]
MIVLDTTVLVYAVGADHRLAPPCRELVRRIGAGQVRATATVETLQEFAHVRARRRGRADAADLVRHFGELLAPPLDLRSADLERGMELFVSHRELGAFDAVLAAATLRVGARALASADRAFATVDPLTVLDPASPTFLDGAI